MKQLLSYFTLCLVLMMQPAQAAIDEQCETILNGAETAFADLFPAGATTQILGSWCFRAYAVGFITRYTGINALKTDDFNVGVYVMGPPFDNEPTYIGTSAQVIALLDDLTGGGGNTQQTLCEISDTLISEIKTIQNGNTLTITTEGNCIKIPPTNPCEPPSGTDKNGNPAVTGISMLTTTELISFEIAGFKIPNIPGFPNPLDPIVNSFANSTCFENVHEESAAFDTKTDICFDISDQVGSIPGISDKVTLALIAESNSRIVNDCSSVGADNIIDLVNGAVQ